jgi:predicted DNA-binding transcriptional regulator YafY
MRADRLISIIMLLQTRERMTAEELSKELDVSQRTIYRDITALNIAGVPVYTDRGPGGGIALLDNYRTSLTGFSEDEARALFMLSIPEAMVELGMDQKLKTALLKLAVSLPYDRRDVLSETQQRIYLDSSTWTPTEEPAIHLNILHQAVWQSKMLKIRYQGIFDTQIMITISPLGLVSKLYSWYLVGMVDYYMRVIRVKDIIEAEILDQDFYRDENFNLVAAWKEWCKGYQNRRPIYMVKVKVAPELYKRLGAYLDEAVKYELIMTEQADESDWLSLIISYENYFRARESILNMGRAVEVMEPEALKLGVIDFARQIVDFYNIRSHA